MDSTFCQNQILRQPKHTGLSSAFFNCHTKDPKINSFPTAYYVRRLDRSTSNHQMLQNRSISICVKQLKPCVRSSPPLGCCIPTHCHTKRQVSQIQYSRLYQP